jgi:HB1, ASXL, restriction endonuclease HTH domain
MSERLQEALATSQTALRAGLDEARAELEQLQAREAELEDLIAQAEAVLGTSDRDEESEGRLTLHEALEQVLRESDTPWMNVRELADEVNRRGLYHKRDGTPVEPNQVHARTKNYTKLFEKNGPRVRLRGTTEDWNVVTFRDDDGGFFGWLDAHPNGYFINAERSPKPNYLVLHRPGCGHFKGAPSVNWTKDYTKTCSDQRDELERWAEESVGGEVTLCKDCFG